MFNERTERPIVNGRRVAGVECQQEVRHGAEPFLKLLVVPRLGPGVAAGGRDLGLTHDGMHVALERNGTPEDANLGEAEMSVLLVQERSALFYERSTEPSFKLGRRSARNPN